MVRTSAALPINNRNDLVVFLVTAPALSLALPRGFQPGAFLEGRNEPVTGLGRHPLINRFSSVSSQS